MKGSSMFNIGLFLAFVGLGIQIGFAEVGLTLGTIVSTIGIVFAIRGYLMEKNSDKLKKDERSKKISAWAASYSWILTIVALMVMFWINKLQILQLNVDIVIGVTYIVMVGSLIFYKYYFNRKGDIE